MNCGQNKKHEGPSKNIHVTFFIFSLLYRYLRQPFLMGTEAVRFIDTLFKDTFFLAEYTICKDCFCQKSRVSLKRVLITASVARQEGLSDAKAKQGKYSTANVY